MKNLSLQMTAASALKPTANKSESNIDKSASTEPSAFNTMLSNQLQSQTQARQLQDRQSQDRKSADKLTQDRQLQGRQVQDKQIQDKQLQDKQLQDKQLQDKQLQVQQVGDGQESTTQNMAKPGLAASVTSNEQAGKAAAKVDKAQAADANLVANTAALSTASALTLTNTKGEAELAIDAKLKAQLPVNNTAESNAASLVAAFNIAVVNPQMQAQSAEAAGSRQKNMDNILSQALTQHKTAADKDAALAVEDAAGAAHKANWLDGVLPTAMRQAAGDELAQTKLKQAGMQQTLSQSQQNSAQLNAQAQNNSQQNPLQQSAIEQNLAQQAGVFAATMPASLQAVASGPALAATQAGSSNFINASPGKSGWDQAISQKVMWMAGEGSVQSATLTLNPPDLGPLQVVIHVNNDQVEAQFMSDNADVRQALQDGLANLREKMNEAGIQLGQTNVSAGGQAQQEFGQAAQGQRAQRMSGGDRDNTTETITTRPTAVRSANGLVDTFA